MVSLAIKILPWMWLIALIVLVIIVVILGPLAIFRKTRAFAGSCMAFGSYAFGASLWVWAFLLCLVIWGWWAVIIGVLLLGFGVVPIAMLATAVKGEWTAFFQIIILIAITFGVRGIGISLVESEKNKEEYEPLSGSLETDISESENNWTG